MKKINRLFIAVTVIAAGVSLFCKKSYKPLDVSELAPTPPMGWNSFDSYGVYLHENAAMDNVEAFVKKLKPFGYEYFVIDAGWFGEFRLQKESIYPAEKHAEKVNINEYGLLQPSKTYFPNGLQPIIDRCHELGLKFGLHLMRGIPREAYRRNTPINGTKFTARDIADTSSICTWNHQNYGINMDAPGAQQFYNSIINQMAEWGVDFIKYDDIVPFPREVEAVSKAISQCGRPIVLSLSPGGDVNENDISFFKKANLLRVTRDIWDEQEGIDECFAAWRKWQGKETPGFWIDMDMIPFGQLQLMSPPSKDLKSKGDIALAGKGVNRCSQLTKPQMETFITLRALAASPLMVGGDLPTLDEFSLSLLTNADMIACNQNGVMGANIYTHKNIEVWRALHKTEPHTGWIGIFNRGESDLKVTLSKQDLGFDTMAANDDIRNVHEIRLKNIWSDETIIIDDVHLFTILAEGVVFVKFQLT